MSRKSTKALLQQLDMYQKARKCLTCKGQVDRKNKMAMNMCSVCRNEIILRNKRIWGNCDGSTPHMQNVKADFHRGWIIFNLLCLAKTRNEWRDKYTGGLIAVRYATTLLKEIWKERAEMLPLPGGETIQPSYKIPEFLANPKTTMKEIIRVAKLHHEFRTGEILD